LSLPNWRMQWAAGRSVRMRAQQRAAIPTKRVSADVLDVRWLKRTNVRSNLRFEDEHVIPNFLAWRMLCCAIIPLQLISCKADAIVTTPGVEMYELTRYDGMPTPVRVSAAGSPGSAIDILSETLTLFPDGNYSITTTISVTHGETVSIENQQESASYRLEGSDLILLRAACNEATVLNADETRTILRGSSSACVGTSISHIVEYRRL
jgi:hypothetical protein